MAVLPRPAPRDLPGDGRATALSASFHDHFSSRAAGYARFRPHYPAELFAWLASVAPGRERAWDCATGNGQAALALAGHFARVCATDASAEQLAHATPHARVTYVRARAEACPLAPGSVELVTVAQALHWLDLAAFHAEVRRVLRPGGLIAAWCYDLVTSGDARIDACIRELYTGILGPYWPPERRDVEQGYGRLSFPYQRSSVPKFDMHVSWSFETFIGYAQTWSASEAYRRAHGVDAVLDWAARTAPLWGSSERRLRWPLALLVGRSA